MTIKSTDGEGTSSGKNGVLKFRKVDEDNQLITNSSVFFDLYHCSDTGELTLLLSDIEVREDQILQEGQPVEQISNLRYGEYSLIESQAPTGYLLDNRQYDFTLSNESSEYTFTLENKKQETKTTSAVIAAEKILTGRQLQTDEFSFELVGVGNNTKQTKKNAADGAIDFDQLHSTKAGVYKDTMAEVIPEKKQQA